MLVHRYDLATGYNNDIFRVTAEPKVSHPDTSLRFVRRVYALSAICMCASQTRISQGGLLVEAGGLTIAAGGLNLTGDITLTSGEKTISHSR